MFDKPGVKPGRHGPYGLGSALRSTGTAVVLTGSDAGVSFQSVHDAVAQVTHTSLANTSEGAWPVARRLRELLEV